MIVLTSVALKNLNHANKHLIKCMILCIIRSTYVIKKIVDSSQKLTFNFSLRKTQVYNKLSNEKDCLCFTRYWMKKLHYIDWKCNIEIIFDNVYWFSLYYKTDIVKDLKRASVYITYKENVYKQLHNWSEYSRDVRLFSQVT